MGKSSCGWCFFVLVGIVATSQSGRSGFPVLASVFGQVSAETGKIGVADVMQ
jgi:hypothetical protein